METTVNLEDMTDDNLLYTLSLHPEAPSVRFVLGGATMFVHPGTSKATDLRRIAASHARPVREGPGFVAAVFYHPEGDSDGCIVARV